MGLIGKVELSEHLLRQGIRPNPLTEFIEFPDLEAMLVENEEMPVAWTDLDTIRILNLVRTLPSTEDRALEPPRPVEQLKIRVFFLAVPAGRASL
ncbi:MAG: hypothetical protein A2V45_09645 [Candidatus Aminicenantes bacterium RBG_19FT_COMBO_58_17]|jgi:hypothetical protein|nr:MAG: hypothetical protein A2V45_09645 [Candidatus Aminicenantes bacterium RBG_19FT_COMBO_58_17]